jgi:hypothetical protein
MSIDLNSILKLPKNCVILTRSIEINKLAPTISINETTSLGLVENIVIHKINMNERYVRAKLLNLNLNRTNSKVFDINNIGTAKDLETVRPSQYANSETWIIAGSSSFTVLIISITLMIIVVYCTKNCHRTHSPNNPVVVVVDDKAKRSDKVHNCNEILNLSNDESEIDEPQDELVNAESAKSHKSAESKKPPFRK